MNFFVDVQGFKDNNNNFILKEFAMVPEIYNPMYDSDLSMHYIIKSPYSLNRLPQKNINNINWVTQNYHGLDWNCGTIKLYTLKNIIYEKLLNILGQICWKVKGDEKQTWLNNFLATIYNNRNFIFAQNVENDLSQYWPKLSSLQIKYPQIRHCCHHDHHHRTTITKKNNKYLNPVCSKKNVILMRIHSSYNSFK